MQQLQEMPVWSLGLEDPLEEEIATHSSILAGIIPWAEELGRLQFMRLQSQDWVNKHAPVRYLILENVLKINCSFVEKSRMWNLFYSDAWCYYFWIVTAIGQVGLRKHHYEQS